MSKHTPGPWSVTLLFDGDIRIKNIDNGINQNNLMREATAQLIAAAPELIDALQRVMRHIPDNAGGASLSDDMHRAKKAITKATGA